MLSIGLMSGTSMDSIDAALLKTDGTPGELQLLGSTTLHYYPEFKMLVKATEFVIRQHAGNMDLARQHFQSAIRHYLKDELNLPNPNETIKAFEEYLHESCTLDTVIHHSTELHAQAVRKLLHELKMQTDDIDVIGYHGQTMLHRPSEQISIIVGNGQQLADDTGITVVNDFRSRDIAAGGDGAPFAPIYHQALAIRDQKIPLAIVNCGGISNITLVKDENPEHLIGFDTGPGNALLDTLVRKRTQGKQNMDSDGRYAKQGKVNTSVLNALYEKSTMKHGKSFFTLLPPKSLDYGDMALIPELDDLSIEDACATLAAFTADTIVSSLDLLKMDIPAYWVLSGGGWNNPAIYESLKTRLKQRLGDDVTIMLADEAGWCSQSMEAEIFAYLAVRSLKGMPISLPGTTRVPEPLSGGETYRPKELA